MRFLLCSLLLGLLTSSRAQTTVSVSSTASHSIPTSLYGLMFEDISSGDGGLYAELLQNRAFQQVTPGTSAALTAWSAVGGAQISVTSGTTPLSSSLPNSLQVTIPSGSSGSVGVANSGYFGINVNEAWTYNASFNFKFAQGSTFNGRLTASLVSGDGTTLASSSSSVSGADSTDWKEFFVTLKPTAIASGVNNTFTVTLDGASAAGETIFFSLFSLFPPTFKNRANGIRLDLAETLLDIKPAFFRFPGGNNLGQSIAGRWQWRNTVGPLTERPGRLGDWGYINTDGLGLKEYLDFIEDMGMEPIMAVWAGFSFGGTVAEADLQSYIQEAIDQINFVVGDPSESDAAALRASLGHPEPYTLKWVEVGNEDFFAADTYASYRWPNFVNALKAAFPQIEFMATTDTFNPRLSPNPELYDVHVYQTPTWFSDNAFIYDGFERNGTKYFEGEYAAISSNPNDIFGSPSDGRFTFPVMSGSAGEAAFMTGLERNSDIVFAASYAPLLQHVSSSQWTPNLISFDPATVIKSTSYYVQQLFSLSKGTEYLPSTLPTPGGTLHWSITRDAPTHTIFIKLANAASSSASVVFDLPFTSFGNRRGELTVLKGGQNDMNTPASPSTVMPVVSSFTAQRILSYEAPPFSLSVFKFTAQ